MNSKIRKATSSKIWTVSDENELEEAIREIRHWSMLEPLLSETERHKKMDAIDREQRLLRKQLKIKARLGLEPHDNLEPINDAELTYKIVRYYEDKPGYSRTLHKGMSLEEVIQYCRHRESSSRTCRNWQNTNRTKKMGHWFDAWTLEVKK